MNLSTIILNSWNNAMTYSEYKSLLISLMANHKTTGSDQSEKMVHYAHLNLQRMKRVEKTVQLSDLLLEKLQTCQPQKWLIITEGWCGDAAQIVPALERIALESNGAIQTRYILRDEHLEIMDQFLTNGGRSIPKLIILNIENEIVGNWGPRPKTAQKLVNDLKLANESYENVAEQLHRWYAKDKTFTLQTEITSII
jgi:hypothetical protein